MRYDEMHFSSTYFDVCWERQSRKSQGTITRVRKTKIKRKGKKREGKIKIK